MYIYYETFPFWILCGNPIGCIKSMTTIHVAYIYGKVLELILPHRLFLHVVPKTHCPVTEQERGWQNPDTQMSLLLQLLVLVLQLVAEMWNLW